jgi:protein gp37
MRNRSPLNAARGLQNATTCFSRCPTHPSLQTLDPRRRPVVGLRRTGARVKFLSLEPLLGRLRKIKLQKIDWVIVGGESGPGARPVDPAWVTEIRDQCVRAHVPFFFEQWGGVMKKKAGRLLDGRTWDEMPAAFQHLPISLNDAALVVLR